MNEYSTTIHSDDAHAPAVTNLVARCEVCGCQWQVRSENRDDAQGCPLCRAPESAIVVLSEAPGFGDMVIIT